MVLLKCTLSRQILSLVPLYTYKGREITIMASSSDPWMMDLNSINQCPPLDHRLHHPPLPQVTKLNRRHKLQFLSPLKLITSWTSPTVSRLNTAMICYCRCTPSLDPHPLPGRFAKSSSLTGSGAAIMAAHRLGVAPTPSICTSIPLKSE